MYIFVCERIRIPALDSDTEQYMGKSLSYYKYF